MSALPEPSIHGLHATEHATIRPNGTDAVVGPQGPPVRAAFVLAGHPRSFTHPGAHRSILKHAVRGFGAHADTFFYLTDDVAQSDSYGNQHSGQKEDARRVLSAVSEFHPKDVYFSNFTRPWPTIPKDCVLSRYQTRKYYPLLGHRSPVRWQVFWQTWEKIRLGFEMAVAFELRHNFTYDWVVRLRTDLFFFGDVPRHYELNQDAVSLPLGVVVCGFVPSGGPNGHPCGNDHAAFVGRRHAEAYFRLAETVGGCHGGDWAREMNDFGGNYMWWHLAASTPIASPLVLYTLLRSCGSAPAHSTAIPQCFNWRIRSNVTGRWPSGFTDADQRAVYVRCVTEWRRVERQAGLHELHEERQELTGRVSRTPATPSASSMHESNHTHQPSDATEGAAKAHDGSVHAAKLARNGTAHGSHSALGGRANGTHAGSTSLHPAHNDMRAAHHASRASSAREMIMSGPLQPSNASEHSIDHPREGNASRASLSQPLASPPCSAQDDKANDGADVWMMVREVLPDEVPYGPRPLPQHINSPLCAPRGATAHAAPLHGHARGHTPKSVALPPGQAACQT